MREREQLSDTHKTKGIKSFRALLRTLGARIKLNGISDHVYKKKMMTDWVHLPWHELLLLLLLIHTPWHHYQTCDFRFPLQLQVENERVIRNVKRRPRAASHSQLQFQLQLQLPPQLQLLCRAEPVNPVGKRVTVPRKSHDSTPTSSSHRKCAHAKENCK